MFGSATDESSQILLVGEGICIPISPKLPDALPTGDFSFARSLQSYHRCSSLTATSVETRASLLSKYPQAASNIASLEAASHQVLYSIDATKLGRPHTPGASSLRNSRYNVIIFNFPHVGGKSTDVNRQVRLNQELVVKFLEHARGLLVESGKVLLTVFEGQPYELWGVRNLARHAGLRVDRSMNFDAELYPGYKHVRTLGNIEGGGGWKGEDRSARMFIFVHGNAHRVLGSKQADGRSRGEDEYEDGDEDDQYHSETTA